MRISRVTSDQVLHELSERRFRQWDVILVQAMQLPAGELLELEVYGEDEPMTKERKTRVYNMMYLLRKKIAERNYPLDVRKSLDHRRLFIGKLT